MRILIIEDSVRLADTIADALRDENYIVDIAPMMDCKDTKMQQVASMI